MTQVTGTITRPGGAPASGISVSFSLVGADRAFASADDETVLGKQPTITTDVNGEYTIDLPGNAALAPVGTMWKRKVSGGGLTEFSDDLIVPEAGGPYVEEDILAAPVSPVPSPTSTALIDYAEHTTLITAAATAPGALVPVPTCIVTVPDLARPVLLEGGCRIGVNLADVEVQALLAPVGTTAFADRIALATAVTGSTATAGTCQPKRVLPAHSPGDYQLFARFLGLSNQTVSVFAAAPDRASLLAVAL